MSAFDGQWDTIERIARYLMAESGKSMADVWEEALSLYRVQFNREVLTDPAQEERSGRVA
jgi:hypothetical protein